MCQLSRHLLVAFPFSLATVPALAHGSHIHLPESFPWTWDIWITGPLALLLLVFARGWWRLRSRSARGVPVLQRRAVTFGTGLGLLAVALISPIHAAGERSFLVHMIEHEILMLAATPLLVMAEPLPVMLWSFPPRGRRLLGRAGAMLSRSDWWRILSSPIGATVLQAAALWLWHAPTLFNQALQSDAWHIVQHLSFILTAVMFWNAMLRWRGTHAGDTAAKMLAVLCLVVTSLVGGALGALMAFAQSPWYAAYLKLGPPPFGLTAMEDQQLAGLVMWVPGGLIHVGAALVLMRHLLSSTASTQGTHDAV
ncbi:cytochrome c oxidase assembly protein [Mesorhizobium sp. RP14(2022)]|uniref:Cytochrome c oxidase assembly protein n=1 Tax=Mesorhizobium liriopis TaxID=2953882 RepID=A0ABT1C5X3_9HYPH|nr:cytochrome c oxidase assembly protein [Mesorhizobium liriopis]MCO6050215.1 cytochrome c oxidase assembly protein [Mesorhizobium liriopis]